MGRRCRLSGLQTATMPRHAQNRVRTRYCWEALLSSNPDDISMHVNACALMGHCTTPYVRGPARTNRQPHDRGTTRLAADLRGSGSSTVIRRPRRRWRRGLIRLADPAGCQVSVHSPVVLDSGGPCYGRGSGLTNAFAGFLAPAGHPTRSCPRPVLGFPRSQLVYCPSEEVRSRTGCLHPIGCAPCQAYRP